MHRVTRAVAQTNQEEGHKAIAQNVAESINPF